MSLLLHKRRVDKSKYLYLALLALVLFLYLVKQRPDKRCLTRSPVTEYGDSVMHTVQAMLPVSLVFTYPLDLIFNKPYRRIKLRLMYPVLLFKAMCIGAVR